MRYHDISMLIHEANRVYFVWESDFTDHLLISQIFYVIGRPNFNEASLTAGDEEVQSAMKVYGCNVLLMLFGFVSFYKRDSLVTKFWTVLLNLK